jgi:CBS domain-containing protein
MVSADDTERTLEEESPGPPELESVFFKDTLKDVLSNEGLAVDEQASLDEALRLMRERKQGCVLVTHDGKLSGIFTERDVLMKIVGTRIDLDRTPIRPYMTREPQTLPNDASVAYALNKMVVEGFRHVPLVDAQGRPTGVVSMREVVEYVANSFPKDVLNLPPEPGKSFREREGA